MLNLFKKNEKIKSNLKAGDKHYRAYIGPPNKYDLVSALQFNLMVKHGLRENHKLLDIGCGSLRGGRLFIVYLLENNFFGVEPEKWLVDDGIFYELGKEIVKLKKPKFLYRSDFKFSKFNQKFDYALAQSIFTHSSIGQINECLQNLKLVAGDNFKFIASFIEGDTNYEGDEWVYPACVTYRYDFFKKLVEDSGFKCKRLNDEHPNNATWVLISKE